MEAGGRWDKDATHFLWRATGRAAQRHPGLAALEGRGVDAVFASWPGQPSCALQKANVACLRSAGAGGRSPAPEVRVEGAGQEPGEDDVAVCADEAAWAPPEEGEDLFGG